MFGIVSLGFTIEVIGKLLIAFTAIMVHHRFLKEHRIDKAVFRTMRKEQVVGIIGVVFIVVGYFIQLPSTFN